MTGTRTIRASEPPVLVYTPHAMADMVAHLSRRDSFALDTESNSFYAYYPRVCLIQISATAGDALHANGDSPPESVDGIVDYLVDPLRLADLSLLGALIATGQHEVIMHAAENDLLQLQRDFGFRFSRIFDTQLAARILGWERVGLGSVLEEWFGVVSDKRMQRTDWSVRPLTPQQIAYAQMDTHYLPPLRDLLIEQLIAAGRWEEAQDAFLQLAQLDASDRTPNVRSFWQMKVSHAIDLQHTGVLEALWEWREREAQRLNRPPFKVLGDDALAELAVARPHTQAHLRGLRHVNSQQASRFSEAILAAVREGERRPLPELPRPTFRPEFMLSLRDQSRFERLRRWRTETARARGVAPEIVFSNDTLLEMVQQDPQSEAELRAVRGVGTWKAGYYGPEVLALLHGDRR
jgi:ribonuclease D